jgi:D-glycerate 3-kinase
MAGASALARAFTDLARENQISAAHLPDLIATAEPILALIERQARTLDRAVVIGLCGAQGSGKTTITEGLRRTLAQTGRTVASLSLDDLYLSRADREALAARVHPLLRTRGVPGTHDVDRGISLLDRLAAAMPEAVTRLPAFDKAVDDRRPAADEAAFVGPADVVLFEGWCVGAAPQTEPDLTQPINGLERDHDRNGLWRRFVNDSLAGPYQDLFSRLDGLALLRAPSFDQVFAWRSEQEAKLRARVTGGHGSTVMDESELALFIAHYERLTRHILQEMPSRADVVVALDAVRRPTHIEAR